MSVEVCTHPWKYAVEPFRILDGLYYVGNANVSSYLIDTGDGLILFDTAFPQTVYLLLESIRRLGVDPDDIAYMIHSHGHYDHMGGTKAIKELTGAKTALGKADADMIHNRPELTWANEYGIEFHEAFDVDVPLEDGQVIALGSVEIECVHTPGHTAGCFSYFFNVTESGRTLRVGTFGGPGLNTLTDEYLAAYGLPRSRRQDYLNSIERLRREHVDVFIGVHPGQSNVFGKRDASMGSDNAFISPGDWLEFLSAMEAQAASQFG